MDINEIIKKVTKPNLYEKGTSFMWTDPYISKQLLQVHLNPDIDIGSRKKSTIEKTAQWILESHDSSGELKILDLGCGPGLYAEIFAKSGHEVAGIDISKSSIDYAIRSAKEKGLNIAYKNGSYLDIDLGKEQYDVIVLIYTDFGVLVPTEREQLLENIFFALKKGGIFIFDVLKDTDLNEKLSPRTWEVCEVGFWRETPYLALSESFLYEKEKVIMFQHTIIENSGNLNNYRFWTHFFSQKDISTMLKQQNFRNIEFRADILPESDLWNGDNVLFTKCEK
ncbi:class I SAM-dependent methyltransferase [Allomuricauda sp. SCSIO 65647]|uniref:class I SAM-dependent methyltransferase n=1 Tax=Allomuricauda sp. SCSIO 65647 TaxID=2908843 RepID=UPI001F4782E6|nr:class I SAM-dependent methyltransferase [Muricauda sp. SCSIO 65647]UJH67478.1 class I SAM-dependent methyltransferase [Muricauda sp. SCSIO 65647]